MRSANNLKFTIEFPHKIATANIFSTENVKKSNTSSISS